MQLRRYWITFDTGYINLYPSIPTIVFGLGCGVTAYDSADAIAQIRQKIFGSNSVPSIHLVTEDVDVSKLDEGHVLPNMKSPLVRGIWFPLGFD